MSSRGGGGGKGGSGWRVGGMFCFGMPEVDWHGKVFIFFFQMQNNPITFYPFYTSIQTSLCIFFIYLLNDFHTSLQIPPNI